MMNYITRSLIICLFVLLLSNAAPVLAANAEGGYLTYHETQPATLSVLSTIAYLLSLLITFAIVIALAYGASRFLGAKMGRLSGSNEHKVLFNLPLGPNRSVCAVEIASKVLILGVTDHSINLLQEITSPDAIQAIKAEIARQEPNQFDDILQNQIALLRQLPMRFPGVFNAAKTPPQQEKR